MTRGVVVDASVAVKWFVTEDDSDAADRLLHQDLRFHAPTLLRTEFANSLWKKWRRHDVDDQQARDSRDGLLRTINRWHGTDEVLSQAFAWALTYDHPVYDLCYLALARSVDVPLLTADTRLVRKLAGTGHADYVVPFQAFA